MVGNDAVLIQQIYPGYGMECLLDLTQDKHKEYCQRHNFDYQQERSFVVEAWNISRGGWAKVELIRRAMEQYRYIVWLDADAFIEDLSVDLRQACKGMGAVKFRLPHGIFYNVGALYIETSDATLDFIKRWLAGFPGPLEDHEQGVFNKMAGDVTELPPRWNYTINRHFDGNDIVVRGYHSVRGVDAKHMAMLEGLGLWILQS